MYLELSQQLFICDDMQVFIDEYRKIGNGICGIKMLKLNTKEKNVSISRNPRRSIKNYGKFAAKFFIREWVKMTVQKTTII